MTALEMKYKFDIKMRELLKSLNHPFNTVEINRIFNEAQLKIVRQYADYFDRNEDVRKILSVLVEAVEVTSFAVGDTCHPNGKLVTLASDNINVVSERVNNSNDIKIKPMSHDEYIVNIKNPFKQPDANNVWRIDRLNAQELITDGIVTIESYQYDYIKIPPDINIDTETDCVLPAQIHEDIIDLAIRLALDIINRKLQTNKN